MLFAAWFLLLTGALIGTVLRIVENTQTAALEHANEVDIATIENGFHDEGSSEAVEVVDQILGPKHLRSASPPPAYILLEDRSHGYLAGNLRASVHIGSVAVAPERGNINAHPASRGHVMGYGRYIAPDVFVFVGRSTAPILESRQRILAASVRIALGAMVLAGCGGILLGAQFVRRIDAVTRTCEAIVAGRFHERVPLQGGREWDGLVRAVNFMLNRMATLVENLRQMSGDIAHDLRTPLTRLRDRLDAARTKAVTATDYADVVARAIDDTERILTMFSAVLRISQIEAGSRLSSFAMLSLSQLLERAVALYVPVAEDHAQRLTADIQLGVELRGDPELLTQLFVNLIENAIRHTPPQTTVTVGLHADNDCIVASVGDDGPGIPSHEQEKVLRRFYRVSRSRSAPGHGLGLAMVAAIAGLHDAALTLADNQPGLKVRVAFHRTA